MFSASLMFFLFAIPLIGIGLAYAGTSLYSRYRDRQFFKMALAAAKEYDSLQAEKNKEAWNLDTGFMVDNDDYYSGSDSTWSPNNHKFAFYSAPVPGRLPMPKPRDLAKAVSGQAVETVDVFGRDMEKISKLKKTKKKAKKAAKKPTKKTKKK